MTPLFDRIAKIKTHEDVSMTTQLFLRSLQQGVAGFSISDIANIGRTATILLHYATDVFASTTLASEICSRMVDVFEPVLTTLSTTDQQQIISLLPSQVAVALVENMTNIHEATFQVIAERMMDALKEKANEMVIASAVEGQADNRYREGEDAFSRVMDEARLYAISDETFAELKRLIEEKFEPMFQRMEKVFESNVLTIDEKIEKAKAGIIDKMGLPSDVQPNEVKEWIQEFAAAAESTIIEPTPKPTPKPEAPVVKKLVVIEKPPVEAPEIMAVEAVLPEEEPKTHYDQSQTISELRNRHKQGYSL